jgi:DNA-directed RNA polymerase subunit RPC12/RpoP
MRCKNCNSKELVDVTCLGDKGKIYVCLQCRTKQGINDGPIQHKEKEDPRLKKGFIEWIRRLFR